MSHFVAYILQFQEIIVYKIPPGGGRGSIASLRSREYDWHSWTVKIDSHCIFGRLNSSVGKTVCLCHHGLSLSED